jgi:hypothetical protein
MAVAAETDVTPPELILLEIAAFPTTTAVPPEPEPAPEPAPRPEGFEDTWPRPAPRTGRCLERHLNKLQGGFHDMIKRGFQHHLFLVALPCEAMGVDEHIPRKEYIVSQYYKIRSRGVGLGHHSRGCTVGHAEEAVATTYMCGQISARTVRRYVVEFRVAYVFFLRATLYDRTPKDKGVVIDSDSDDFFGPETVEDESRVTLARRVLRESFKMRLLFERFSLEPTVKFILQPWEWAHPSELSGPITSLSIRGEGGKNGSLQHVVSLEDETVATETYMSSACFLSVDGKRAVHRVEPSPGGMGFRATMPGGRRFQKKDQRPPRTKLVYDVTRVWRREGQAPSKDDLRQLAALEEADDKRNVGCCSRERWRNHPSWNRLAPEDDVPTAGPKQERGANLIDLHEVRTTIRLKVIRDGFKVGAANLTLESITDFINEHIVCPLSQKATAGEPAKVYSVSRETVRKWLHELGFSVKHHTKGIFFDGHDDDAVVAARDKYLGIMRDYRRRARFTWVNEKGEEEKHVPQLRGDEKEVIFVTHDEASAKTNDGQRFAWASDHEQVLKKKSDGANFRSATSL